MLVYLFVYIISGYPFGFLMQFTLVHPLFIRLSLCLLNLLLSFRSFICELPAQCFPFILLPLCLFLSIHLFVYFGLKPSRQLKWPSRLQVKPPICRGSLEGGSTKSEGQKNMGGKKKNPSVSNGPVIWASRSTCLRGGLRCQNWLPLERDRPTSLSSLSVRTSSSKCRALQLKGNEMMCIMWP